MSLKISKEQDKYINNILDCGLKEYNIKPINCFAYHNKLNTFYSNNNYPSLNTYNNYNFNMQKTLNNSSSNLNKNKFFSKNKKNKKKSINAQFNDILKLQEKISGLNDKYYNLNDNKKKTKTNKNKENYFKLLEEIKDTKNKINEEKNIIKDIKLKIKNAKIKEKKLNEVDKFNKNLLNSKENLDKKFQQSENIKHNQTMLIQELTFQINLMRAQFNEKKPKF
jgi:hypothetical protein